MQNQNNKNKDIGSLDELKEKYEILKKQYNLPEFKFLNENFEIENLIIYDSEVLLKKIRKQMIEKIYSYLRLFEIFLNPSNAPQFIFNILKSMNQEDKDLIQELYKKLSKYEIDSFELEVEYNLKKEVEMIKEIVNNWQDISKNLTKLFSSFKGKYDFDIKKQDKSYFG